MRYLSPEEILILHALIVDKTGGSHGVRDAHLLASIAHKPQLRFGGKDLYSDIFTKAGVLLEAVVDYHIFVDGNKRTSLIAVARFLQLNGYQLTATNSEAEETILMVATKRLEVKELAQWLKKNSKKIKRR